jgi:hypothetical protein
MAANWTGFAYLVAAVLIDQVLVGPSRDRDGIALLLSNLGRWRRDGTLQTGAKRVEPRIEFLIDERRRAY